MIGWRGASRYYDEKYSDAFALECAAVKRVRSMQRESELLNHVRVEHCRELLNSAAPPVAVY